MKIAIDAMGGDHAPAAVVAAAEEAARAFPDDTLLLFGDVNQIQSLLSADVPANIVVKPTTEVIATGEEPVRAVRRKKDASMVRAARAVKDGEADAMISAGNTGALLTVATLIVGRIRGVDRAAVMVDVPNLNQPGQVMSYLDAGANAESKANYLWQYAIMGQAYQKRVKQLENPRIGLLNNGSEAEKGTPVTKEAYQLLSQDDQLNFVGNVEARELLQDSCDVLVTDGFTGNAALKATEGAIDTFTKALKQIFLHNGIKGKLGGLLMKDLLKRYFDEIDYESLGGGLFMGVKRPVLKAHGNAEAKSLYATIMQARTIVSSGLYEQLSEDFTARYQAEKAAKTNDSATAE
ncbi:MAG: phosphate acyltransferase PlsX [Aerococcus sp.]|nr:phosphate acyltransferase PlsX [Aerococcus sp.]